MALAAYNGGYGNAVRWAGGETPIDQDLFLENVTYEETRSYLQAVGRNLRFYRALYGCRTLTTDPTIHGRSDNMRILAIDVGTGTQDIVLFDSAREPENCFKMVMPAPTQIVAARVRAATNDRRPIVLTGRLMGGGPVGWAIKEHLEAGLAAYAEPAAARTLNDDLERCGPSACGSWSPATAAPRGALRLTLGDLDLAAIEAALAAFGIARGRGTGWRWPCLITVTPRRTSATGSFVSGTSAGWRRQACGVAAGDPARPLLAFAYTPVDLPAYLTRMAAVAAAAPAGLPMALLDTGAAAGLGALLDPRVAAHRELVLVNVGNMHTLATHMAGGRLAGIVEHHTGRLTPERVGFARPGLDRTGL